jgi:hypothetical protein
MACTFTYETFRKNDSENFEGCIHPLRKSVKDHDVCCPHCHTSYRNGVPKTYSDFLQVRTYIPRTLMTRLSCKRVDNDVSN